MVSLKERKQRAEEDLRRIQAEEDNQIAQKVRDNNFERFMKRCNDWIIGKAHAQFELADNGWHAPKGERLDPDILPSSVSIHGNCGHAYPAKAQVTSATNMYFHNIIPGNYQRWFAKKMLDITKELMEKVLGNPKCVVELMALQSTSHWRVEKYFNEEDIPKIDAEIIKAQDEILSRFSVNELEKVGQLHHGGGILVRHLEMRKATVGKGD